MDLSKYGRMKPIFMKLLPVLKAQNDWKIAESKTKWRIKILHSNKVAATTKAVKEQYPNRTLVVFKLHTYSSLNAEF
jgi:hypothetical protein